MWNEIRNAEDDEEAILAKVLEESLRHYNEVELPRSQASKCNAVESIPNGRLETDLFAQPSTSKQSNYVQQSSSKPKLTEQMSSKSRGSPEKKDLYDGEEAEGFDLIAGKTWLYPTNYPIREYQRSIVNTALFHNTLVSLPTGLGKTFIAAVVMYNFYKWYPKGKIIFLAPTKPLVAQQVEHCYNTMGIPKQDTAEMTGALPSKDRGALWKSKRVFFLTPQVVQNDLGSGICPAMAVKCIVFDEAHRATGEYAYCMVVKLLQSFGAKFRVLALSATPGSDITAVQKVVSSLMISHIEIRNEDSPDLAAYTHERRIEIMSVSVGPTILQIREKYLRIMGEYCRKLQASKVLFGNIASLSSFQILKSWNEFRSNPPPEMSADTVRVLSADFALLHSLAHGLNLLQNYGLRLLLTNITDVMQDPKNSSGARLKNNEDLQDLLEEIRTILDPPLDSTMAPSQPDYIYGHPKLDALKDVVENHFKDFEARGVETRVIVFCEYREAVIEIRQLLTALQPLVKPVGFMGQSTGKHGKGISQKNQLLVMEQFRKGVFNTLVSTSVGEEGLDIGEVDLIICYDAKNSPIRQVQRMGRTGRKRKGRIIVLVTEGKEELKFRCALAKKKNINALLVERDSLKGFLLEESPSMLPDGFQTECVERNVVIAPSTSVLQQQDLRKMFSRKTTNNATSGANNAGVENAYIPDEELNEMLPEAMQDIRKAEEHYKNLDLSLYLEWQRYLQYTHEVDHSTSSEMLKDLLIISLGNEENKFQGLQTQITATQIWPGAKKRGAKRSSAAVTSKRKKPRLNTDKKRQSPASPTSSQSSDYGPVPSSFQAKPGRANPPPPSPSKNNATEVPVDHISMDIDPLFESSLSEMEDDTDDDVHPEIRAALKKLGRAFRKQDDSFSDDDSCAVCAQLDPGPEMQKMLKEAEETKPKMSWVELAAMLNKVKSIVPRLKRDSFSLPTPPDSPVFVSLIPRDDFNDGIICGGVGDVSTSPKESEVKKYHSDVSMFSNTSRTDHPGESSNFEAPTPLRKSEVFSRRSGASSSPGMDHIGDGATLDDHLDDIFAKIESQRCRNGDRSPKDDLVTSPILGSQFLRKARFSPATPTPKSNPRRSLFTNFQSQTPKAALNMEKDKSPIKSSGQRDIRLDFESFLFRGTQSSEENVPQVEENGVSPVLSKSQSKQKLIEKRESIVEENGVSPVLSKSQSKQKLIEKRESIKKDDSSSPVVTKTGTNEQLKKEYEAFFQRSEDDMFEGLDIDENIFNVSNVQKLDLFHGFMHGLDEMPKKRTSPEKELTLRKEESTEVKENTPRKEVTPVRKADASGSSLSNLVWMDKSNGPVVASLAPPQSKKPSKLSLKKNVKPTKPIFEKTSKKSDREEKEWSPDLPDCFQPKKTPSAVASKSISKPQVTEVLCVSSDEDDFSRKIPDFFLSPIAKPDPSDRPVTPNEQLDELVRNLPTIYSDSSPEKRPPHSTERDKRKRMASFPPSPEMPRKKQNVEPQSSPESPLFVKPKKGFKRPLDETIVESQRIGRGPFEQSLRDSLLFAKPKMRSRQLLDETVAEGSGWLQTRDNARKSGNSGTTGKSSKPISFPESSDEEFGGGKASKKKTKRQKKAKDPKKPKKKKKKKSSRFAFLESQAVESDDDGRDSSDGESTSLDGLDSSFIDDSPNETVVDVDMHARYLQAVRSPAARPNAFKIPHPAQMPFRGNVYSQAVPTEEYSSYMNDSFCVDEEIAENSDPEMSLLEIAEARLKAAKKKRRDKEKRREPKKRSRIIRPKDSSESEDDIQLIEQKPRENKENETKVTNSKPVCADMNLGHEWYDDDFDVSEINLVAFENLSTSKPSSSTTSKPGSSSTTKIGLSSTSKPCSSSTSKAGPSSTSKLRFSSTSKPVPSSISKPGSSSTSRPDPTARRLNTYDINHLLDDDFDFSEVASVEGDVPSDFVGTKVKGKGPPVSRPSTVRNESLFIFVSVRQAASAVEILRLLRITYKITPSCRSSTKADYVISRRLGVCRIAISDLKSSDKLEPIVLRLKESFLRPILIVENDKENKLLMATKNVNNRGNVPLPKSAQPEWTLGSITTLNNLREASVEVLFSDEKASTARLLASLTKSEQTGGYGIPSIPQEFSNEMEKKLKFLTMIPGINIALAVHLIGKFKTIKSFVSNCSKVIDIQRNVGVKNQTAQKIYNILQQVHIS